MAKVNIPFMPEWRHKMRTGIKTYTCRTKKMAQPGDYFEIFDAKFLILSVRKTILQDVAISYFRGEGCDNPDHFIAVWNSIHPKKGYVPEQEVWLHQFERQPS